MAVWALLVPGDSQVVPFWVVYSNVIDEKELHRSLQVEASGHCFTDFWDPANVVPRASRF